MSANMLAHARADDRQSQVDATDVILTVDRPTGPRAGSQPAPPAGAAARGPGPRRGGVGPLAPAGRHRRGRRGVPERGGKKACRTTL